MHICALLCTFDNVVSVSAQSAHSAQECTRVHNVFQKAMRKETGAYRDNHRGSSCSDATTCLPISRRACRPLCRVRREVHRLLIFSFFVARPCLAAEAESDRILQSGPDMPDMAQNHP